MTGILTKTGNGSSGTGSAVRIGVPPFLNVKPLVFALGLETFPHNFIVSEHPPSALCSLMRQGKLDVALLPAADIFGQPDLRIVKGVCISSFGQVGSVVVFSKKPLAEIRTVAVDSSSSSSAMMLRVALEIFYGCRPAYEKREYGERFFSGVDAGLVIGNTGLVLSASPPEGFSLRFDLGSVWTDSTGLPFVYAVFAVRAGVDFTAGIDTLLLSKSMGIKMLPQIAENEHSALGLRQEACRDYLENRIGYDLGEAETEGLLKFGELVSQITRTQKGGVRINFYR